MISAYENDTIMALATPPGQGGIAIVRVSGENAVGLFEKLFKPAGKQRIESHRMLYGHVLDAEGNVLDECMGVVFFAPRSYTRENVAEFHLHGGEEAARGVMQALLDSGAREAEPGEFTRRAFLNGRIDLSQAEAVMSVISAHGEQAARAAERQLAGGASSFVHELQEELTTLLAGVTAALDYPEEISEEEAAADVRERTQRIAARLENACDERGARFLEQGMEVVLYGRPNVGKSSILNALLMEERAIVTDIPGTTRDIVKGSMILNGLRINLSDTAGIREQADRVEAIGVERARKSVHHADLVLLVLDASEPIREEDRALLEETADLPRLIIANKSDVNQGIEMPEGALPLSARTGEGMEMLRQKIAEAAGKPCERELTSLRHMRLAKNAAGRLRLAEKALEEGLPLDLAAVDLQEALETLGGITGERVDEKLLDSVFSNFCVGK